MQIVAFFSQKYPFYGTFGPGKTAYISRRNIVGNEIDAVSRKHPSQTARFMGDIP
jgi:hypothetical protein